MSDQEFNNTNVPEYPDRGEEFATPDYRDPSLHENVSSRSNPEPTQSTAARAKKAASSLTKIMALVAAATTTVAGVSVLAPSRIVAHFAEVASSHDTIYYSINVTEDDQDLWLYVTNANTHRAYDLIDGQNNGEVTGLKPEMEYKLTVKPKSGLGAGAPSTTVRTEKRPTEYIEFVDYTPISLADYFADPSQRPTFTLTPYWVDETNRWGRIDVILCDSVIASEDFASEAYLYADATASGEPVTVTIDPAGMVSRFATLRLVAYEPGADYGTTVYTDSVLWCNDFPTTPSISEVRMDHETQTLYCTVTVDDPYEFWGDIALSLVPGDLGQTDSQYGTESVESGIEYPFPLSDSEYASGTVTVTLSCMRQISETNDIVREVVFFTEQINLSEL